MVSEIFEVISDALTAFFGVISTGISEAVKLFYTAGTSGQPGTFTFLGYLALIGLGCSLVWVLFKLIKGAVTGATKA